MNTYLGKFKTGYLVITFSYITDFSPQHYIAKSSKAKEDNAVAWLKSVVVKNLDILILYGMQSMK